MLARIRNIGAATLLCCAALAGCASVESMGVATPEQERRSSRRRRRRRPICSPARKSRSLYSAKTAYQANIRSIPAGVSLPLAGTVKAAGLSQQQLEKALTKKFQSEYLRDPKVTVEVSSFRPFYILGEVTKPGQYPYTGGLNVMSAVALAGGSTYRASRTSVMI